MPTPRECLCMLQGDSKSGEKLKELDVVPEGVTRIIEHEVFFPFCLNQWVLQTAAYQTRQQYMGKKQQVGHLTGMLVNVSLLWLRTISLYVQYKQCHVSLLC